MMLIAKDGNGQFVHIDDNSLASCFCVGCGSELTPKRGDVRIHHFAHRSGESPSCSESALHAFAKHHIASLSNILLPPVDLFALNEGLDFFSLGQLPVLESSVEAGIGSVIADTLLVTQRGPIAIEVFVTHKVDSAKEAILNERGASAVEICLGDLKNAELSVADLKHVIESRLSDSDFTRWLACADELVGNDGVFPRENKENDFISFFDGASDVILPEYPVKELIASKKLSKGVSEAILSRMPKVSGRYPITSIENSPGRSLLHLKVGGQIKELWVLQEACLSNSELPASSFLILSDEGVLSWGRNSVIDKALVKLLEEEGVEINQASAIEELEQIEEKILFLMSSKRSGVGQLVKEKVLSTLSNNPSAQKAAASMKGVFSPFNAAPEIVCATIYCLRDEMQSFGPKKAVRALEELGIKVFPAIKAFSEIKEKAPHLIPASLNGVMGPEEFIKRCLS